MLRKKRWFFAVLALLPVLAIFATVRLYPIGETLRLSLHKWDILSRNKPFIGFANFRELMGDRLFQEALLNTTIIAFGVLLITIPLALVLAALIHYRTRSRFAGFYETAIFLPHVVSLVPAAMAWKWIFDARLGPLNAFLNMIGLPSQSWLFDPKLAVLSVIVLCAWQALGYAVLIYLVGFKSLPLSLYEAAKLDGASGPQSFWFLSIPLLKPITLYVSVVTLVSGFNVYAQAFVLASDAQGAPGRQVRVLVLDMLENSFRNYRVGYAASEAVVLLLIVLFFTLVQFSLLREKGPRMSAVTTDLTEAEHAEGSRRRTRRRLVDFAIDAVLMVFSLLMLLPLVFLVSNGFKTPAEILAWPPTIIPNDPTLVNFEAVLADTPLLRWIGNSLAFAVLSSISILVTSAIAGYVLAKFRYRSLSVVFMIILATAIVPFEVYMIPLYFQAQSLGILNTTAGLLLGYLVMSFGIFLIRQNVIHSIPDELLEAARIDGAGELWIFWRIVLPLLRGALGALFVLAFFQAWTAFAWPMIVATKRESYTIEVGLALFQTGFTIDLGRLSAASAIVLIPSITLFVLLRRNFVQGVANTGLKE